MTTSQYFTANGLRLHYLAFGHPQQPRLICIHGLSGNAHNFDRLAPQLTDDYHVIAVDVRGRGDSQWAPADEYNVTAYANDLAVLVENLGGDSVTLLGTSMGGMIAILYAGGHPQRVQRIILNDVGPEVDPAGIKRINEYMGSSPTDFANLTEVAAWYRENYPAMRQMAQQELLDFVRWAVTGGPNGRLRWKMDPAIRTSPRTGSAARPLDMWVPFARINAPVLVVRGAESDILSRPTLQRICAVLPQTVVVEIPGVGHAPSLLEPEALSAIKRFLA